MKQQITYIALIAIVFLAGYVFIEGVKLVGGKAVSAAQSALATPTPTPSPTMTPTPTPDVDEWSSRNINTWRTEDRLSWLVDCTDGETSYEGCSCMLDFAERLYTVDQLEALNESYGRTGYVPDALMEAAKYCAETVGY